LSIPMPSEGKPSSSIFHGTDMHKTYWIKSGG
jgi:hypothetical protein